MAGSKFQLSVVVPIYNEAEGLSKFNSDLVQVLTKATSSFEIIYVNDGSEDNTASLVNDWNAKNPNIKLLSLTRNFGKEYALLAGVYEASGEAVLMLDGDGQHPIERIPDFIKSWKDGSKVVIGVRKNSASGSLFKRVSSKLFYFVFNKLTKQRLDSTDYRLIDRSVQQAFMSMKETDRVNRGLIDWLGFSSSYIYFKPNERQHGSAGYSNSKLIRLAANSFVSLTPTPLYIFGYLGILITFTSFVLGLAVLIEQVILSDPLHWKFTGTAMLGIIILFLVGIVLMSQGILSLYVSNISNQSKGRPLFVIDYDKSFGISTSKNSEG